MEKRLQGIAQSIEIDKFYQKDKRTGLKETESSF